MVDFWEISHNILKFSALRAEKFVNFRRNIPKFENFRRFAPTCYQITTFSGGGSLPMKSSFSGGGDFDFHGEGFSDFSVSGGGSPPSPP